MRTKTKKIFIIISVVFLVGTVAQAQTIDISGSADCDGWSSIVTLGFPDGVYTGSLEYSMVLTDLAGTEVTRFDYSTQVYRFEDPVMVNMFSESWGLPLDSIYQAQLVFHFLDLETAVSYDVVCAEEIGEFNPCRNSSGYWKTNPAFWPVESLVVGGISLNQDQLVDIMMRPIRGNGSLLMARELIAAKLNVANGCDDFIEASITEGDLFLTDHPLADDRWRNSIRSTRELRLTLAVYNKAGCDEMTFDSASSLSDLQFRTATSEELTFGSLKAMYR